MRTAAGTEVTASTTYHGARLTSMKSGVFEFVGHIKFDECNRAVGVVKIEAYIKEDGVGMFQGYLAGSQLEAMAQAMVEATNEVIDIHCFA